MKKVVLTVALFAIGMQLTSCRGYEREQDRLDKESEGKGALLKAESTKKVKIEEAKANYESAKLNAQTKLAKAEASAKAKIIESKANAESILIEAESQAKANQMLNTSITPTVLEYKKLNKWNGKLPTVMGSSGTIIDLK
jgi:regulator of protease activity HflC (stomatin/prohibitin superfamily)